MREKESLRSIDGVPSIILDVVRLCAALAVFYIHSREIWFPNTLHDPESGGDIGQAIVMVLVVLSGYVIAYTALNRYKSASEYGVARLSRIYSVLIPGLIISIISQVAISIHDPSVYGDFSVVNSILRYILSASLLNQALFISADPLVNGSLWTLSYEFMFYLLFGLWYYKCKTTKSKVILIVGSVILIPKIVLLLPVWILGTYAYRKRPLNIRPVLAYAIFVGLILLGYLFVLYCPPLPVPLRQKPLFYSGQFITDFCTGVFIAAAFFVLPNGKSVHHLISEKAQLLIRKIGDLTYPIYVFHFPLLLLYRYFLIDYKAEDYIQFYWGLLIVLLACICIGHFANKSRRLLNIVFSRLFGLIKSFGNNR